MAKQRGKYNVIRLISGKILRTKTFRATCPERQDNCYRQTLLVGLILIMKINNISSRQYTVLFVVVLRQNCHFLFLNFQIDKKQYNPHLSSWLSIDMCQRTQASSQALTTPPVSASQTNIASACYKAQSNGSCTVALDNVKKHMLTLEQ